MPQIKNSDIVGKVLKTLINISSRKTTEGYAVSVMDTLIKKLEEDFDFLKHVEIRDARFLEDESTITVMSELDSAPPTDVGKALSAIITTMNKSLGKDAGHFFIKEIQRNLGADYSSTMKEMGVDLGLMQLEFEVSELERAITTRKGE